MKLNKQRYDEKTANQVFTQTKLPDIVDAEDNLITDTTKLNNRQKYGSFWNYVLNDKDQVVPFLLPLSYWSGAVIFVGIASLLLWYGVTEIGVIIGVIALLQVWNLIQFYRKGGMKIIPKVSANEFIWNKKGKDMKIDKRINERNKEGGTENV